MLARIFLALLLAAAPTLGRAQGAPTRGRPTFDALTVLGTTTAQSFVGPLAGNASSASILQTPRTIALTGDAACSFLFDGSGNAGCALILPASGATAGNYGTATAVPAFGVSAKGLVTATGSVPIAVPSAAITDAASANTPSVLVKRDASGNFAAGTIIGALSGNAATASTLQTPRTLAHSGDATGSAAFDGSGNVTIPLTLATTGATAGSYGSAATVPVLTFSAKGLATVTGSTPIAIPSSAITDATAASTALTVVKRDAAGNFAAGTITAALAGNATSATTANALTTARTIAHSGDATGSASFDGSANVTIPLALASTGVTAGSFGDATHVPAVTVDAKGRITGVSAVAITYPVTSVAGRIGAVTLGVTDVFGAAPLASPALTGTPTAPTAASGSTGTQLATLDFVNSAVAAGGGAGGSASSVLYIAQTLSASQQDQVRVNVGAPVSSAPSASATLAAADIDRPLFPTGTITLTAASNAANSWRSGPIKNANTATGLITLAVPSGATLDGATNGTTTLFPYQRARIVQTGASAYVTDWIERSPILAVTTLSGVASASFTLPAGYAEIEADLVQIVESTSSNLTLRLSQDGSTFNAGSTDFAQQNTKLTGSASTSAGSYAVHYLCEPPVVSVPIDGKIRLFPGNGSVNPRVHSDVGYYDSAAAVPAQYLTKGRLGTVTTRSVAAQVAVTAGTLSGTIILRGVQ